MFKPAATAMRLVQSVLFPTWCLQCGSGTEVFCSECLSHIPIRSFNESWERLEYSTALDRVFIASWYDHEGLQTLLQLGKYKGVREALTICSQVLIRFAQEINLPDILPSNTVVMPVPLHYRRLCERGYNQAEILAEALSAHFSLSLMQCVKRTKYTKQQTGLALRRRTQNVANAFRYRKDSLFVPKSVLLIDDVVTTGATCNEIALVLKQQGVEQVCALVVAKN